MSAVAHAHAVIAGQLASSNTWPFVSREVLQTALEALEAQMPEATPPADDVREALAHAIMTADEPTLDYERRLPDPPSDVDDEGFRHFRDVENWELYLPHADAAIAVLKERPREMVTEAEPVAWAIYGQVTGNLKQVTTSEETAQECAEHFTVRPLFLGEARS